MPRLWISLIVIGVGIALTVNADLGLGPWDVFHQGLSDRTGVDIGTVSIVVGFVVLLAWFPLHQRPGIGTITNIILLGVSLDVTLALLPETPALSWRVAQLLVGVALFGPGIAGYLSCQLGAGPRDGVMTAIVSWGYSLRFVRTAMELTVLALGYLLGGSVGWGTIVIAFTIGPNIHWWTDWWNQHPFPDDKGEPTQPSLHQSGDSTTNA